MSARTLYVDPFGGVAGDMLLGALLDLGVELAEMERVLGGLDMPGWRLAVSRDRQQGFAGTRVTVGIDAASQPARHLRDVETLLQRATLPPQVREHSLAAFHRLFEAEAAVHGVTLDKAHLHELAAVDAVVDIVGSCAAVELLGVDAVIAGPVPVGRGSVQTDHGLLPVPPPAVTHLLTGVPLAAHAADGEMTTPTGATLITTLATSFGPMPAGRIAGTGVGLGMRRFEGLPNMLRVFLIEAEGEQGVLGAGRPMTLVECTVDDVPGETLAWMIPRLLEAGAVDAWTLAGTGRKGRPVTEVRALCEPALADRVVAVVFSEGVSLGVRTVDCRRPQLDRRTVMVATSYGTIPVKVGLFRGAAVSVKPEHDACAAAARQADVPLIRVFDAAREGAPRIGDAVPDEG